MVKLQKLVLRNFKSFKKADIPLSKGFTAIVGSNGSGKTNVLDALLFVLGISSMKMLRVSKVSELVNSSAVENYAKVELTLKHKDKIYTIQRMIDKQGKCIYRLDGKRKTKNELTSLLSELGIKPDGHNIVVQGDTTRIIEMSPLERRQIIDELAGLQEFDAKKEEALKELQKVDNKLRDAGIVLQERENYLEQLRQDKEAASEFEALKKESRATKAAIIFSEIERIERSQKKALDKLEEIESERKEIEQNIGKQYSERAEARARGEELNKQILAQREKIYATVGAKLEETKTRKALLEERSENKRIQIQKNEERASGLEEKAKRIDKEIESQNSRIEEIKTELNALTKQIKEASRKKAELKGLAEEKEEKIKAMNQSLETASSELDSLNQLLSGEKSKLELIQKEAELKKETMRETMHEIEKQESELAEKEKKNALLVQLRKQYGNILEEVEKAENAREKSLILLKEAWAEKKSLTESIEMLKKSFATCPVCDSELEKSKKESLAAKKQAILKQAMEKELSLKEREKETVERLGHLRKALEKEHVLEAETIGLSAIREKLKQSREKLSIIKQWLLENSETGLKEKISGHTQKLEEKRKTVFAEKEKIKAVGEGINVSSLQKAVESLALFEKQEHGLKQEKESLASSSESHFLGRKKEALSEASSLLTENQSISKGLEAEEKLLREKQALISELEAKVSEAERQGKKMEEEKSELDIKLGKIEEATRIKQAKLKDLSHQENTIRIENGKEEVRLVDLKEEFKEFEEVERAKETDVNTLNGRLKEIDVKIEKLGAINMKAIKSFDLLAAEVLDVRKKVEKLDEERLAVVEMIEKIDVKRTNVFMECFEELGRNFSKMFSTLFSGEGFLELSNRESPLESGLLIQAKHKGDAIRNIDSMSGGEKTMTALAFLFAIQLYEPAAFYVFDEADAALDKENSLKMAKIIREISMQSQFIAITHNDPLVQEANQIIGVALNKQKSSVIGLKLKEKND